MRHEKYFSSAAGETSEASTAANVLGSIHEAEGGLMIRERRCYGPQSW